MLPVSQGIIQCLAGGLLRAAFPGGYRLLANHKLVAMFRNMQTDRSSLLCGLFAHYLNSRCQLLAFLCQVIAQFRTGPARDRQDDNAGGTTDDDDHQHDFNQREATHAFTHHC